MLKVSEIVERANILKRLKSLVSDNWNLELTGSDKNILRCVSKLGNRISIYNYTDIDIEKTKHYPGLGHVDIQFNIFTRGISVHLNDNGTVYIFT